MTSEAPDEARSAPTLSAGALLRDARKAQGLHLAAIAASIKVTPQKLEALENDRFDQLPDATFTRALAQAMCRVLKIDPQPVLARLPEGGSHRLDRLEGGLNQAYRDRPGHVEPRDWSMLRSPAVWGPALLVIAAAVLLLAPFDALRVRRAVTGEEGAASAPLPSALGAASAPAATASSAVAEVPALPAAAEAAPAPIEAAAASAPTRAGPAGLLVLRASEASWVDVKDAQAKTLIFRTLHAGETVTLDGTPPLRVRIGNAKGTQLVFRGEAIDPAATTRDNIARLELK
jgi:cytoskeleton protein RodZ